MNSLSPFYFPFATDNFKSWAPKQMKSILKVNPLVIQDDIIYRKVNKPGDKVLIVGGGPSTNTLNNTNGYDNVWSMNKCYQHPLLSKVKLDLIGVGAVVNLNDPLFVDYINKFSPQLAFEIHPKWAYTTLPKCGYFHTKIYGQIGMGVRLINLAAALGAKQVDFIGLDGPKAIIEGNHAFEPGKKELPSLCNSENAHQIHLDQYNYFWGYIKQLYPDTVFNSLDKENEYHKDLS